MARHNEPSPHTIAHDSGHEPTDWELVAATHNGDTDAFGVLYQRHASAVLGYARHRVGDYATAEDITSETFTRLLAAVPALANVGKPILAVLYTITRNLIFDRAKSSYVRTSVFLDDPCGIPLQRVANQWDTTGDDPETHAIAAETARSVREAVSHLTDSQRECITLRFFGERSVRETATAMGRNEGAVRALTHRAAVALAELLPEDRWA